ncbi:DUF3887 domain-containing protein [Oceanobacillus sp. CAU 1775]
MKKMNIFILLIISSFLILAGCNQTDETSEDVDETTIEESSGEETAENEEIIQLAEAFIEQLNAGEYQEATAKFDETMSEQFSASELEETWISLNEQLGGFIDKEFNRVEEVEEYDVILITGIFNDADVTFQISFDDEQQIAGFYVI